MKIVKLTEEKDGYTIDSSMYPAYAESMKDVIPENIYSFMSACWHYAHQDYRCLHDATVKALSIQEETCGDFRSNTLTLTLNGAYNNVITLQYETVSTYSMTKAKCQHPLDDYSHGDLIVDEMLVGENGSFTHEIIFTDAHFNIQFSNFIYTVSDPL